MSSSSSSSQGILLRNTQSPRQQYPPSPPLSRSSNDSDDSLRALELSDGPVDALQVTRPGRSYSISGFDFQHDLLPLSTSLSETDGAVQVGSERNIGLVNGRSSYCLTLVVYSEQFVCSHCVDCRAAGERHYTVYLRTLLTTHHRN